MSASTRQCSSGFEGAPPQNRANGVIGSATNTAQIEAALFRLFPESDRGLHEPAAQAKLDRAVPSAEETPPPDNLADQLKDSVPDR